MRIISGSLKGKLINFLKNSTTRPLKDTVKENIFNILNHSNLINIEIKESNVLDLYSGIGSFGIECISRGAKKVTFIENNKEAVNILNKNLIQHSIINKTSILKDDINNALKNLKDERFNIFFLDPPFANKNFVQNIEIIKTNKMFQNRHIVILHREKKTLDDLEKFVKILAIKQYGRSKIIFGVFN